MTDDRLQRAWREWVVEASPEAAFAYCTELARADQAPCNATVLNSIAWEELGSRHEAVQHAIYKAAEKYLGGEPREICLEQMAWVTECHYWVLGDASPSTMRVIARVYKEHGLKLKPGNEEEAERDHERMRDGSNVRGLRFKRKNKLLEGEVKNLKTQLATSRSRADRYERENLRLESLRTKDHDISGLKENFRKLQQENERLAKIIQEATRRGKQA